MNLDNLEIAILTFEKRHGRRRGTIGSSIIQGEWLAKNWPQAKLWTEGMKSDVLIFQKVYWEDMLRSYPGIKILHLCDPDWLTGELELRKISLLVDAITCSSEGIYNFVKKIVDCPVYWVDDRVDLDWAGKPKEHLGKAKNVVWFGYHHNAKQVLPMVLPSLARLGLGLIVISNNDFIPAIDYGVKIINKKHNWESLRGDIMSGDIVINPQPIDIHKRFQFKSQNKTITAWSLGMPVANTVDELKRFIDEQERKKEAEEKLKIVREKYDAKISALEFKEIIKQCLINKQKKS